MTTIEFTLSITVDTDRDPNEELTNAQDEAMDKLLSDMEDVLNRSIHVVSINNTAWFIE